jgi:hypothetical protein
LGAIQFVAPAQNVLLSETPAEEPKQPVRASVAAPAKAGNDEN